MGLFVYPKNMSDKGKKLWIGIIHLLSLYMLMTAAVNWEHFVYFSLNLAAIVFVCFCPTMWYLNKDLKI